MADRLDIFGCCNPMAEWSFEVDHKFIEKAELDKGSSNTNRLKPEAFDNVENLLLEEEIDIGKVYAGGSGSNVIRMLSSLGWKTAYLGAIGDDMHGKFLESDMIFNYGVSSFLVHKESPTCRTYTMITPGEKERTFALSFGAAAELEPADIVEEGIRDADMFFLTGYKLTDKPETAYRMIDIARASNTKIILDLSCPLHVEKESKLLEPVLEDKVHILLTNEEETEKWLGVSAGSPCRVYHNVARELLQYADIVAQKIGDRGAIVATTDDNVFVPVHRGAFQVEKVVSMNGAGDGFAAGLLHGLRIYENLDVELMLYRATRLANYFASEIISQIEPCKNLKDVPF